MIVHVLPGDSLSGQFAETAIGGKIVVFRECMVVGDLGGETLDEFWERRANFLMLEHGGDPIEYQETFAREIEQLLELTAGDEINLWFEFELFCQANMWFCLDLLNRSAASIYRVAPADLSPDDVWKGFADHDADRLLECFDARTPISKEDTSVASRLWQAFRNRDSGTLRELGEHRSAALPFLKEVADAAADIETRPAQLVAELKASGHADIDSIFPEFQKRAGVYGFGDLQVERILERSDELS